MVRLTRGVDTGIFYPGPKTLFHALKKPVALYAGRIAIEKNINAFLDMPWHGDKVVAGYGPDLEKLKKNILMFILLAKKPGRLSPSITAAPTSLFSLPKPIPLAWF